MKLRFFSFTAIAAAAMLSGCNSTDIAEQVEAKSVMYANDTEFGSTSGDVYDTGAKLYDQDNSKVGFIDIDGLVYASTDDGDEYCGGELVGLCSDAEFGDDGRLVSDCMLPPKNDALVPGEPILPEPWVAVACGEKL